MKYDIYVHLQVNNNGDITFAKPLRQYTSNRFPINGSHKIIAPFWTDIDTINGGSLWYRTTTNKSVLQRGSNETRALFPEFTDFSASWMMIVTWDDVAAFMCTINMPTSNLSCTKVFICYLSGRVNYILYHISKSLRIILKLIF